MKKSASGGVHVKSHMRAGHPVKSYVRGSMGRVHPDGNYKQRSKNNILARLVLNQGDSTFRKTGKVVGGISRIKGVLNMVKKYKTEYNADAPSSKVRELGMGYALKDKANNRDKYVKRK